MLHNICTAARNVVITKAETFRRFISQEKEVFGAWWPFNTVVYSLISDCQAVNMATLSTEIVNFLSMLKEGGKERKMWSYFLDLIRNHASSNNPESSAAIEQLRTVISLKKASLAGAVRSSVTGRFSCWASNLSLSLVRCAGISQAVYQLNH